jgi:hypothetical protein
MANFEDLVANGVYGFDKMFIKMCEICNHPRFHFPDEKLKDVNEFLNHFYRPRAVKEPVASAA